MFTLGGYAITHAGRHAEAIGGWLFIAFALTAFGTAVASTGRAIERHYPVTPAGREAMIRAQTAVPPGRAWAQIDVP